MSSVLRLLSACFAVLLGGPPCAVAQDFDGITIIELGNESGADAIRGIGGIPGLPPGHIVTFVAASGTYAALVGSRGCAAWAVEGSYTGASITFGLPASVASVRSSGLCQPFTLTYIDAGTVRVEADDNLFDRTGGPLDQKARILSYSGTARLVAHVPLMAFDWGLPVFERHDIDGVMLGPLERTEEALAGRADISVGTLQEQPFPARRFEARLHNIRAGAVSVSGYLADRQLLAWPWDVLVEVSKGQDMEPVTRQSFESAASGRYGEPSCIADVERFNLTRLLWVYDLAGRKLGDRDSATDNCLATQRWWVEGAVLPLDQDIGPWGCSLVMAVDIARSANIINQYRTVAVGGYGAAINHFLQRVRDMEKAKQDIMELQEAKPRL